MHNLKIKIGDIVIIKPGYLCIGSDDFKAKVVYSTPTAVKLHVLSGYYTVRNYNNYNTITDFINPTCIKVIKKYKLKLYEIY